MSSSANSTKRPQHKEEKASRLKKDEQAVEKVVAVLSMWRNPFKDDEGDVLCNIASGISAPEDVKTDLLCADNTGKDKAMKFVRDRLVSETIPFHDTLPKLKLCTFKSSVKALKVNVKDKEVIVKADCNFFARMLVIAQSRAMDLQHVLKFSIGPVPWSLATPDGQLRKTTKAVLLNLLEKGLQPLTAVPDDTVCMLDVTALLQSMPCSQRTFGELAEAVFAVVTSSFNRYGPRIDLSSTSTQLPVSRAMSAPSEPKLAA